MERSHTLALLVFATSLCLSACSKTGSISPALTAKPAPVLLLHRVGLGRRQYPQRLVGGGDPARRCGPQRLRHDAIGLAG